MNKLEIKNLVKEAIQEIKQENLQQESKLGKILGGVAFVAALLAGNAKLDQSFYKNDPQIIQLEKDLLKAKESGDKEKIKDIARKLKNRKIVVTPFK
jgi:hypoxanthine-guanine phosphoribosyltransferase